MTDVPPLPPRPSLEDPPSPKRGSWLAMLLAAFFAMFCLVGISLLTFGYAAIIFAVVAALFGLIAFHYLVWGWWLAGVIEREEAEQESGD
jgi:hypothetical protein